MAASVRTGAGEVRLRCLGRKAGSSGALGEEEVGIPFRQLCQCCARSAFATWCQCSFHPCRRSAWFPAWKSACGLRQKHDVFAFAAKMLPAGVPWERRRRGPHFGNFLPTEVQDCRGFLAQFQDPVTLHVPILRKKCICNVVSVLFSPVPSFSVVSRMEISVRPAAET